MMNTTRLSRHAGGAHTPQPVPFIPPAPVPPRVPLMETPAPEIVEPPRPGHFPLLVAGGLLWN